MTDRTPAPDTPELRAASLVMPAKAGISVGSLVAMLLKTPAYAGVTEVIDGR